MSACNLGMMRRAERQNAGIFNINMEGDEEDDDDFQTIKRKKTSSNYSRTKQRSNVKPKRGLSLSQKSTPSKKKAYSIRTFLKKEDVQSGTLNDKLTHCPVCQLPFVCVIGQSVEDHVQECVTSYSEPSVLCPNGIKCNSMVSCHFTQYSHRQLASLRGAKAAKNRIPEEISTTDANLKCTLSNLIHTSSSSLKTDDIFSGTPFPVNSLSLNTLNSTKQAEQALPMFEDIPSTENNVESQTQSSEKENLDDFSHWLDDDFEYEDFDINSAECTPTPSSTDSPCINTAKCLDKIPYTDDSATTLSVVTNTSAEKTNTATNFAKVLSPENSKMTSMKSDSQCQSTTGSAEKKITFAKSSETQKRTNKPSTKQMDIGVYFGLKPKHKVVTNRSEDVSGKILQPKRYLKEQGDTQCSERRSKKCPFYKIVEGTSFAVDAFSYGHIPGISAYFLSHFHYDHYGGLKRSFSKPIYCSQITANLILLKIKVAPRFIHPLSLSTPTVIQNVEVTLLEANHCPGAVIFLFKLSNGQTHLHTGDFRASKAMEENLFLSRTSIHTLYLDTTYCDPSYTFPPQSETVEYCASLATEAVTRNAKTLIVVGTYTIGKEKIFLAVANALGCKVAVQRDKYNVLQCLESEHLKKIITQNYKEAAVHVLPMAHLVHMKLAAHLEAYSSQYSELLAFKPTGWTFTDSCKHDLKNIRPSKRASVTIYGIPYSEHSSFNELKQFVQYIKPRKIIPTVNNGSATRRDEMKNIFETWLRN